MYAVNAMSVRLWQRDGQGSHRADRLSTSPREHGHPLGATRRFHPASCTQPEPPGTQCWVHTHIQAALVSLCSPSWYRRRHTHTSSSHHTLTNTDTVAIYFWFPELLGKLNIASLGKRLIKSEIEKVMLTAPLLWFLHFRSVLFCCSSLLQYHCCPVDGGGSLEHGGHHCDADADLHQCVWVTHRSQDDSHSNPPHSTLVCACVWCVFVYTTYIYIYI